eukprot:544737-Prymnesium_polylepis.1
MHCNNRSAVARARRAGARVDGVAWDDRPERDHCAVCTWSRVELPESPTAVAASAAPCKERQCVHDRATQALYRGRLSAWKQRCRALSGSSEASRRRAGSLKTDRLELLSTN